MMSVMLSAKSIVGHLGKRAFGLCLMGVFMITAVAAVGYTYPSSISVIKSPISLTSPRVLILKSKRLLHLFDEDRLVRSYVIDLGVTPVGQKLQEGDGRTPVGLFHIVTKNSESPYHRFLGIDYPNAQIAASALKQGLISPGEAASIQSAIANRRCPDWGTTLGGGIGLHGGRQGKDWTGGCIALSDQQIDELFWVLRVGDPIEILP